MPGTNVERYQRWFLYEKDAHAKTLASLKSVPAVGRSTPEFARAAAIFGHIVAARRMWLHRFGVVPGTAAPLFPGAPSLVELEEQWRIVQDLWDSYLDVVSDADLEADFSYQSLDSGRFCNRVEDVLAQLFGHSWYHRGQIAMLVRAAGGEPALTDLIYWCRQSIDSGLDDPKSSFAESPKT